MLHLPRTAIRAGPWTLRNYLFRSALRRFAGGELFLLGIMILAELFSSMWRLLAIDAPVLDILSWVGAGAPAHALEVLPIALLFGVTLSLAELQAEGEFLAVCGSGVSLQSLSLPLILLALCLGAALQVGGDGLVVPASVYRDRLYAKMTGQRADWGQSQDITIIAAGGRAVYRAGSFDPAAGKLLEVELVFRGVDGEPELRLLAPSALWRDGLWRFQRPRIFERRPDGSWTERDPQEEADPRFDERPSSFAFQRAKPPLMTTGELSAHAEALKAAGLPSAEAETEYHKRLSFLLTPLVVCGLSLSFSGFFRKNVLLMSLLFSLATATVYYVAQMLGSIAAKLGLVDPALAVWGTTALFVLASAAGFLSART